VAECVSHKSKSGEASFQQHWSVVNTRRRDDLVSSRCALSTCVLFYAQPHLGPPNRQIWMRWLAFDWRKGMTDRRVKWFRSSPGGKAHSRHPSFHLMATARGVVLQAPTGKCAASTKAQSWPRSSVVNTFAFDTHAPHGTHEHASILRRNCARWQHSRERVGCRYDGQQ